MRKAIELALKGRYTARPNPMVGCILVSFNELNHEPIIIGEGYHAYCGAPHAEVEAIAQATSAGFLTKGATAYLNLAPCCHTGKTPPCIQALIQAKVGQVIYAIEDPNPVSPPDLAQQLLEQAGITVVKGILAPEANKINQGFIYRMRYNRPYVRAKVALSLDGNVALQNHQSQWITSEPARAHSQHYRAISGAIITGMGTVIYDDPKLTVRDQDIINLDKFKQPISVVINSKNAPIMPDKEIFQKVDTLVFKDNIPKVLSILAEQFEINEVLLESGPGLFNAFLSQHLIDEWVIYLAPKLLGKAAMNISQFGPLEQLNQAKEWVFEKIEQVGDDIVIVAVPKSTSRRELNI